MVDFVAMGTELLAQLGDPATYTPPGGVAVATLAAIEHSVRPRADGVTVERVMLAHLPAADVPEPVRDAVLAIGAAAYRVEAIADADEAVTTVTVRRT